MHAVAASSFRRIQRFITGTKQGFTEFVRAVVGDIDQPIIELTNDEADAD